MNISLADFHHTQEEIILKLYIICPLTSGQVMQIIF